MGIHVTQKIAAKMNSILITIYMEKISPIAYALALVHKATFFKIFDKYFTKESK